MNILITGSLGMIGFSLCRYFLLRGHKVISIDYDFAPLKPQGVNDFYKKTRLRVLSSNENFRHINFDLRQSSKITQLISSIDSHLNSFITPTLQESFGHTNQVAKIDYIIHLAGFAQISFSSHTPEEYLSNNLSVDSLALSLARAFECKVLLASSSSVYGNYSGLSESELLSPSNMLSTYAFSKYQGEQIASHYSHLYGVRCASLRFFTVYGQYPRPDMLVHRILESIYDSKLLQLRHNGQHKRDFTYCEDLCQYIYRLCELGWPFGGHEIINMGSSNPISTLDMTKAMCEVAQKISNKSHASVEMVDQTLSVDAQDTRCNNEKLLSLIGTVNPTSLHQALSVVCSTYEASKKSLPILTQKVTDDEMVS